MAKQITNPAHENVDELLLAALRRRGDETEGAEADDAFIATIVQAHLDRRRDARAQRSAAA